MTTENTTTSTPDEEAQFSRLCEYIHNLGPEPMRQALRQVSKEYSIPLVKLKASLDEYNNLDKLTVVAVGADMIPPASITLVPKE